MTGDAFRSTVASIMVAMKRRDDEATLYALRQARARARWAGLDDDTYASAVDLADELAKRGLSPAEVRQGAGEVQGTT
jgi:hypothetical protein